MTKLSCGVDKVNTVPSGVSETYQRNRVWRGFYFRLGAACASAEPAMRRVRLLDRPSRSAAEASFATAREVCFVLFFFVIFVTSLGVILPAEKCMFLQVW